MAKQGRNSNQPRFKLGEMLVKCRVITGEQLETALQRQQRLGGRLGRNLIHLGFISEDVFLRFLSSQLVVESINLNTTDIPPEVQRLIPLELVRKQGVLPVRKEQNVLYVGMTDPSDLGVVRELEFSLGFKIEPMVLAESQWEFAVKFFLEKGWGNQVLTKKAPASKRLSSDYTLKYLMQELVRQRGSDIHLSVGMPPTIRVDDQLVRLSASALTPERMEQLLFPVLSEDQKKELETTREIDFALSIDEVGRFRFNIYQQKNCLAAALRYIVERIPSLEDLGLPAWLSPFVQRKQGLILVTGPSGHGKSTTMACLLDIINTTKRANIITIEDPIEYVHHHKTSNVNQREIGTDTFSFGEGIKHIFRQDPDVIAIGEMRDLESISTALTAAETGHLVLATLHTQSAMSTLDRIVDAFPGQQQNQVRSQLATSLILVFSQRLVPRADGSGRILAYEKLINSYRVQNAIRENRTHILKSQAAVASEDYNPIEFTLAELVRQELIRKEEALKFCEDAKLFDVLLEKRSQGA